FGRDEVLHLVAHPAISGGFPEVDPEQWIEWCGSLGIAFGADEREFERTYISDSSYHWDQGLSRLALGVFMGGEASGFDGVESIFHGGNKREYLPFEIAQDESESAAILLRTARALIAD